MRRGAPLVLALAACGPVPVADAERFCVEEARSALAPRGEVAIGTGPVRVSARVWASADFLRGRDPAEVFDTCVRRRSGMPPLRPLALQPGWVR